MDDDTTYCMALRVVLILFLLMYCFLCHVLCSVLSYQRNGVSSVGVLKTFFSSKVCNWCLQDRLTGNTTQAGKEMKWILAGWLWI